MADVIDHPNSIDYRVTEFDSLFGRVTVQSTQGTPLSITQVLYLLEFAKQEVMFRAMEIEYEE